MNENCPEGFFGSNGGAYTKREVRVGPPLDYIAEKFRTSIYSSHSLWRLAKRDVPDGLPQPDYFAGTEYSVKNDSILAPCHSSFSAGLVAFLALYNMLDLANQPNLVERLLEMESGKFNDWLTRIEEEGSIHGV